MGRTRKTALCLVVVVQIFLDLLIISIKYTEISR